MVKTYAYIGTVVLEHITNNQHTQQLYLHTFRTLSTRKPFTLEMEANRQNETEADLFGASNSTYPTWIKRPSGTVSPLIFPETLPNQYIREPKEYVCEPKEQRQYVCEPERVEKYRQKDS